MARKRGQVVGVDLFCGVGGLTYGLQKAGIRMVAGIDLDPACEYPYVSNNGSLFIEADIRKITSNEVALLYPPGCIRLLAGCAPCRPFSPFRRGMVNSTSREWRLLGEFARLIAGLRPELVTMENVPGLASRKIFRDFVEMLRANAYHVAWKSVNCARMGVPQYRRRLVLVASLLAEVRVPAERRERNAFRTVRQAIGRLPPVSAGQVDPVDRLHFARALSETNLRRLRASTPGGTWKEWPADLRSPCHRRNSGATYRSVYSRMRWDEPSPTITTQAHNFGTGRFGHPEQDRPITLREAAILQTFPRKYRFFAPRQKVRFSVAGRLIGNAVPPALGVAIGTVLLRAVEFAGKR